MSYKIWWTGAWTPVAAIVEGGGGGGGDDTFPITETLTGPSIAAVDINPSVTAETLPDVIAGFTDNTPTVTIT